MDTERYTPQPDKESPTPDLENLLTHNNPHTEEYQKLIEKAVSQGSKNERAMGSEYRTTFSTHWWKYDNEQSEGNKFFRTKLDGETLINLGGWDSPFRDSIMRRGTIINVDRFSFGKPNPKHPIELNNSSTVVQEGLQSFGVSADMLDFISRLPDNSVNIEIDGIDNDIIPNDEYHQAMAREILRVTKKGGIMMGIHSNPIDVIKAMILKKIKGVKRAGPSDVGDIFEKE